jgi:uncharacterized glyoxalase superfamily protein PhnB
MSPILGIAPVYCVRSVEETSIWYVQHLGFETKYMGEDYAIISKDAHSIHLSEVKDENVLTVTANNFELFIEVGDEIDAYFDEVMKTSPQTQISAVADRPWGNREFHIKDPNGALIRVGRFGI